MGKLWKYLPKDKSFYEHLDYVNNYCLDIIKERRGEAGDAVAGRKDLLSRVLSSAHVSRFRCCCMPVTLLWSACQ